MDKQIGPDVNLDTLYSHYLANLKNVILKVNSAEDVNYCKRWIDAFNNCPINEKVVRNCLVSLMYQQLEQDGRLSEPFTDLSKIYCNFNNIFIDEDTQELLSTSRSPLTTCDFIGDSMESDISPRTPSQKPSGVVPKTNRHLAQIDDLTTFIVNMKTVNDSLRNELKQLREQNSLLEMKIERKGVEMEQLLRLARSPLKSGPTISKTAAPQVPACDDLPLSSRINNIIESYDVQKMNLSLPLLRTVAEHGDDNRPNSPRSPGISEMSSFSETQFIELLDHTASALEEYLNPTLPLDSVSGAIDNPKFTWEWYKRKDLALRVHAFQKRIYQALNNARSRATNEAAEMNNQDTAVQTDIEQFQIAKLTTTKTTQTQIFQDSEMRARDSLKIDLLRSCVYKLKRSRDKLADKYEREMKEKSVQEAIQRKLWKLQIASIRSHLQMNVACKSQTQLCEITEALESKYRSIISETFDKFLTSNDA